MSGRSDVSTAIVTVLTKDWRKVLLKNNEEVYWSELELPDHVRKLMEKRW